MSRVKTNTQFVRDMMEFSDFGGLSQLVILEAIRFYTGMIVQQDRPEPQEGGIVCPRTWWDVNADIHRQIMARMYPAHAKEIEEHLRKQDEESPKDIAAKHAETLIYLDEFKKRNLK